MTPEEVWFRYRGTLVEERRVDLHAGNEWLGALSGGVNRPPEQSY